MNHANIYFKKSELKSCLYTHTNVCLFLKIKINAHQHD